ncbi:hypothetical protein [Brevibacillus sp. HD3.3A]|uniref:hypothetical protein n=1 Tax=Brevibacillus sp. HD3.3A TaxID=2738979 RepID=UPI00156B469F|nr:hypothetical protein [Brevibacillus sp. HD3.3A]UED70730.1 hypothetical protein HP435_08865 [Brevibacillus sp. HD3.3A]
MILSFSGGHTEQKAVHAMKWMIINDKLKQGINGIEWLVLQTHVTESMQDGLNRWLDHVINFERFEVDTVMRDVLKMDADAFYAKYELNWWMSLDCTIRNLNLIRQSDYEKYFSFLMTLKGVDKAWRHKQRKRN